MSKSNKTDDKSKLTNYFKTDRQNTNEFFKDSKVESCSHVLVKNGQTLAVPFNITNQKGKPLQHYKYEPAKSTEVKSIYRKDFSIKPDMHVGMEKKPLMPYDPESYRNRLPIAGIIMPHKNKSVIEIGDRSMVNRKQWKSTARDTFTAPKTLPISNTGISSDLTKRAHMKLESII